MKAEAVATQVIDKLLGQTDFTPPIELWVALYTTSPLPSGGGTEVAGNGYARVQVPNDLATWPAAVAGVKSNAITIQFPAPTGTWGTIVGFGLHTHSTNDALHLFGDFEEPILIGSTDDPKFTPGDLTVEET